MVVGLAQQEDRLLLVRQRVAGWDGLYWTLPGGTIEAGEVLTEALCRELREETGLIPEEIGPLVYLAQIDMRASATQLSVFVVAINTWSGDLKPDDPDQLVTYAEFVELPQALVYLEQLPWRHVREPICAYLRGSVPLGTLWCSREQTDGRIDLLAHMMAKPMRQESP